MNEVKWKIVSIVLSVCLVASIVFLSIDRFRYRETRRELEYARERVEQLERELDRSTNQLFSIEQSIDRCVSIVGESEEILSQSRDTIDGIIETARELRAYYTNLANELLRLYRDLGYSDPYSVDSEEK